jgi:hypothetical protein
VVFTIFFNVFFFVQLHAKPQEQDLTLAPPSILPVCLSLGHFDFDELAFTEIATQLTVRKMEN